MDDNFILPLSRETCQRISQEDDALNKDNPATESSLNLPEICLKILWKV